jgi:hypothetical protein
MTDRVEIIGIRSIEAGATFEAMPPSQQLSLRCAADAEHDPLPLTTE